MGLMMDLDPEDNTEMQFLTRLEGCQSDRTEELGGDSTHSAALDPEHATVEGLSKDKIQTGLANALQRTLTRPRDPETCCPHFY